METKNIDWTKGTDVNEKMLQCSICFDEIKIYHCSNWHDGTGIFYCICNCCKKEINVRWKYKDIFTQS